MSNQETPAWHDELIEYIANPCETRTWQQFCDEIGLSNQTVWRYRRDNRELIRTQSDTRRKAYLSTIRELAYKALVKRIGSSDMALKMALQITGDLVERSESRVEYLTPEQKQEKIKQLLAGIQKREEGTSQKD